MLGIDNLLTSHRASLTQGRVGLLAHPASIDSNGRHTADLLHADPEIDLIKLFGPEHGFFGKADAGEKVGDSLHPTLELPVFSLYGEFRQPPEEWLEDVDLLVFDLQDLGVRCYTFLSTLYLVMKTAAVTGTSLLVLERPITAPGMTDGALPEEALKSFVAQVDVPLCHGMTPGQAAVWMNSYYALGVNLQVIDMSPELHAPGRERETPWRPPSPAIKNWDTARVYPCTVFAEAFPGVSVDRKGDRPFQFWGMERLHASAIAEDLQSRGLNGVNWNAGQSENLPAIQLYCSEVGAFRPVTAALHLLDAIAQAHSVDWLWGRDSNNPQFFDKLMGTSSVRQGLLDRESPAKLAVDYFQTSPCV